MSLNLRIETGRWTRLPRKERLHVCGQVQTERHVMESCDLTKTIRDNNRHYETYTLQFLTFLKNKMHVELFLKSWTLFTKAKRL